MSFRMGQGLKEKSRHSIESIIDRPMLWNKNTDAKYRCGTP